MAHAGDESTSNLITHSHDGKKKKKGKRLWSATMPHSDIQEVSPVASASRDQVQRAALLASLSGRSFEDVKFFAFSCRTRDGNASKPLPLLANSALLRKASSHFDFGLYASDLVSPYLLSN